MRRAPVLAAGLFVALASVTFAQEREDVTDRVAPQCALAALVAVPPPGWFNVPMPDAPAGHRGCLMIRTDENEVPLGFLRIRSFTAPALPKEGDPYEALFIKEVEAVQRMGYAIVDEKPLFVRTDLPIRGDGFRDAKGLGLAARIEGNPVPQEVHLLMFRSDRVEYIVSLMTPAKSYDAKLWERNTDDFGILIRTLQQGE